MARLDTRQTRRRRHAHADGPHPPSDNRPSITSQGVIGSSDRESSSSSSSSSSTTSSSSSSSSPRASPQMNESTAGNRTSTTNVSLEPPIPRSFDFTIGRNIFDGFIDSDSTFSHEAYAQAGINISAADIHSFRMEVNRHFKVEPLLQERAESDRSTTDPVNRAIQQWLNAHEWEEGASRKVLNKLQPQMRWQLAKMALRKALKVKSEKEKGPRVRKKKTDEA